MRWFLGSDPPFSFETLNKAYTHMLKYGMLFGVAPMAIMLQQPELISENNKEEMIKRCCNRAKCMIEDTLPYL